MTVEHATDAEFQTFVDQHHIPVNDAGIAEWSFDDRVRTINFAMRKGIDLELFERAESINNSPGELFMGDQPVSDPEAERSHS